MSFMCLFIVETPIPKAKRSGIGVSTIPRSGGFNNPQLAADYVSKACFGVDTRDLKRRLLHLSARNKFAGSRK
jgi:hypothetical protein